MFSFYFSRRSKLFSNKIAFIILLAGITITGCKKEKILETASPPLKLTDAKAGVPAYVFDYENADFMPTPPGANQILVPWASGSNQLFSDEIAFDYKKVDGWELVYNTFSPTNNASPNFFTLYNKYRGILRFYLYIQPGGIIPSSYLSDGLSAVGVFNSTIMNFSNEVADLDNPVNSTTRIQHYQTQSTGAWYVAQYEMAYDPNIVNATQQNLKFVWNTSSTNLSNVILNGESNGTLTGTIGTESPGGFNLGKLLGQATKGVVYAAGFKGLDLLKIGNTKIKETIVGGVKSGLSGAVQGFMNAIFGGSPTTPQLVNLTMKTSMNVTGTIASSGGIASPSLIIPGTQTVGNGTGYTPAYNDPLGVVYISQKPIIYAKAKFESGAPISSYLNNKLSNLHNGIYDVYYRQNLYSKIPYGDASKFTIQLNNWGMNQSYLVYNPKLIDEGVTFKVIREDILVPYTNPDPYLLSYQESITIGPTHTKPNIDLQVDDVRTGMDDGDRPGYVDPYKGFDTIGDKKYIVFGYDKWMRTIIENYVQVRQDAKNNVDWKGALIRFTILVTPPNGGKPITIVKTFKPEIKMLTFPF